MKLEEDGNTKKGVKAKGEGNETVKEEVKKREAKRKDRVKEGQDGDIKKRVNNTHFSPYSQPKITPVEKYNTTPLNERKKTKNGVNTYRTI